MVNIFEGRVDILSVLLLLWVVFFDGMVAIFKGCFLLWVVFLRGVGNFLKSSPQLNL